jgi:predicted DNA-binding protein
MQAIEFESYFSNGYIPVPPSVHLKEGQKIRVLILINELEQPEMLEELQDIADAEQTLQNIKSGKEKTISWEQIKIEAGL